MAKYGSDSVAFFAVDGYDLTGLTTDLANAVEATIEDTTGLGDSWAENSATGTRSATLSAEGFYDDDADASNAALSGNEQTSRLVAFGYAGNTIGQQMTMLAGAFGGTYARTASRNNLHRANATWTVNGQVDDGVILHALGAISATGTTTAVDNSASSASGGVAQMHVTAVSGTSPTLDAVVRHSADDTTYADLATFTQATAATAERKTVTGTVNRYLKCSLTIGGSSTPTVTAAIGFARG